MILALSGFPLVLVSIIAFILILGMIILVHEGGHFFFAKKAGILCHEFSIGMGPAIWKKKYGSRLYIMERIFPTYLKSQILGTSGINAQGSIVNPG